MSKIKVINSEMAVDDETLAPFVVITLAVPMEPVDPNKDINEVQQELANGIVEALDTYRDENPPKEFSKALPLSTHYKEKEDVRHTDED